MSPEPRASHVRIATVLFFTLLIASITPIRSYDYFWHLATGRWIADHGRLPESDPFSVASDRGRWVNGEWLFQLLLFGAYKAGGHHGISIARGVVVAALFVLVFLLAVRRAHWSVALLLTLLAWFGADHRLTPRPETIATFFVVAAVAFLTGLPTWRRVVLYAALTALWINIHPSALLAPVLAAVTLLDTRNMRLRAAAVVASFAALFLNPHGIEGVLAPLRLMRSIGEGTFRNLEWLPSLPQQFPLLYLMIASGLILFSMRFASNSRREGSIERWRVPSETLVSLVLFSLLAYLAIRHVRNQGFFFAAAPILLASLVRREISLLWARGLAAGALIVWITGLMLHRSWGWGVDATLFPVNAVERLRATGVQGTIYNPDQFGGFLIWSFYPERRALTDGRNELYATYLREYNQARYDSRAWNRLLQKYSVRAAIDEHRAPMEVIHAYTGQRMRFPAWTVLFPSEDWALVGYDSVGMALVRRDSVAPERLERLEASEVSPPAP